MSHTTVNPNYSSSMALQPGVGLGLLYNTPPSLSIPCSVSPFIYSHSLNVPCAKYQVRDSSPLSQSGIHYVPRLIVGFRNN